MNKHELHHGTGIRLGLLLITTLLILSGTAAAGSILIDTTGLTGEVGTTVQVPVKVTGASSLFSMELQFNTGDTTDATIAFNEESMKKYGLIYNQATGKVAQINLGITGDETLFSLDVTPKTASAVPLIVTVGKMREGSLDSLQPADYTAAAATLSVSSVIPSVTPTSSPGSSEDSGSSGGSSGSSGGSTTVSPVATGPQSPGTQSTGDSPVSQTSTADRTVSPTTAGTAGTTTTATTVAATTPAPTRTPLPVAGIIAGLGIGLLIIRKNN